MQPRHMRWAAQGVRHDPSPAGVDADEPAVVTHEPTVLPVDEGDEVRWLIFVADRHQPCAAARQRDGEEMACGSAAAAAFAPPLDACTRPSACDCQLFATSCDLQQLKSATFRAGARPCAQAIALDERVTRYRSHEHAGWLLPLPCCDHRELCDCDIVYGGPKDEE